MAKKDKSQHDSNEVMKYYNAIWEERCRKADVDEKTKGYFAYISREVMASDKNSNRHKKIWNRVELLMIGFATCNTIFAALINFDGAAGMLFKILTIITSALISAVASYNAYKKPKETWMRHRANCLALDIETLCFCNGTMDYEGKTDAEAIKLYQERTTLAKLNNYENFFSNMGYVKFQSGFTKNKKENT